MPRGDGTGPSGEGPMTGRAAGYCAGESEPNYANRPGHSRGIRGRGLSRGRGRGFRNRFYATGVPFGAYPDPGPQLSPDEEQVMLRTESKRLKSVLETIEYRLQQLEKDKT